MNFSWWERLGDREKIMLLLKMKRMSLNLLQNTPYDVNGKRIVISTHVKYEKPLYMLLESLSREKVENERIIIVTAGCEIERAPWKTNENYIRIDTTDNDFEFTSVNKIKQHHNHEYVKANIYMFIHDTCIVVEGFKHKLDHRICKENEIISYRPPCSSIFICHKNVIERMHKIETHGSKQIAISIEHNKHKTQSIYKYGKFVNLNPTYVHCKGIKIDIYNTGHERIELNMPELGIKKYVFFMFNGDFTGNVCRN